MGYSLWDRKELDTTERLNNNNSIYEGETLVYDSLGPSSLSINTQPKTIQKMSPIRTYPFPDPRPS